MKKLSNALDFNVYIFLSIILLLVFSGSSNFYHLNYQANLVLFFSFLILAYNFISNRQIFSLCYIDYFFIIDFIYNFIAIFYSKHPRVSIEENIYHMTYILTYFIIRGFSSFKGWPAIIDFLKVNYYIFLFFIAQIYYIVFYKFELISQDGRISCGSTHPNLLSSLILIFTSITLFFLIKAFYDKNYKIVLLNIAAFILSSVLIILTSSRGGMLGLFFGTCSVFFFAYLNSGKKIKSTHFIIIILAALLSFYIFFPNHFERVTGLFDRQTLESLGSRSDIWKNCFKLFLNYPIFGVGPGGANYSILEFVPYSMVDAHNFLLEKLCNLGLIGTFFYLLPLLIILIKIIKTLSNTVNSNNYNFIALSYCVLFMLISVFTNSSFSPHYVIPAISMLIYSILAMYVSRSSDTDDCCILEHRQNFKLNILITFIIAVMFYHIKTIFIKNFESDFLSELFNWHFLIICFIISYALCFVNTSNSLSDAPLNTDAYKYPTGQHKVLYYFTALLIIFSFYSYKGLYFYAAERANEAGIRHTFSFSSKNALKCFNIAITNDPDNIAYLLNKSYILFMTELINGSKLKDNHNIENALALLKQIKNIFKLDIHNNGNISFLESKLKGALNEADIFSSDFNLHSNNNDTTAAYNKDLAESINNTLLLDSAFSFAKFSDLYNKNALDNYLKINAALRADIDRISSTTEGKSKEIELSKYFPYITISYKAALNYDIHQADKILESGVSSAIQLVKYASKYIPLKGFEEKSIQYRQQFEILSTVAFLLPAIWKHGQNHDYETVKSDFYKFMGANNPLFTIIDHFLYGNELNIALFNNDETLKNYLISLKAFSDKNYDAAIANLNSVFKSPNKQLNAALYSWIYYKAGKLTEARDLVFYSHLGTLKPFRRDFIYKRNILFGGAFTPFYYIPLQTYFNEFIMLALIKMHNGDHTMVLREIFDYLNTVVYNQ